MKRHLYPPVLRPLLADDWIACMDQFEHGSRCTCMVARSTTLSSSFAESHRALSSANSFHRVDLVTLIERLGFCLHLYADDMQIYGSGRPSAIRYVICRRAVQCIDDVHKWMTSNVSISTRTRRSSWSATVRRQHQLPGLRVY